MRKLLRYKLLPIFAGLFIAFLAMMIFEYINSFIYPIPNDLNVNDIQTVQAFTASLPWTAYILVLLGWIVGSFKAGGLTTYLSRETKYRLSFIVGILLTLSGIMNNLVLGHNMIFNIIALPMFIVFTYLGHVYMRKILAKRVVA